MKLQSFVAGRWQEGKGTEKILVDASTGEKITVASADGIDIESAYHYARTKGNPSLRKLTFRERGILLKKLAMHLLSLKDKFYTVSFKTGATKSDSWIDIEGGIGNLFSYASLRRQFQDLPYYVEGESIDLSRGGPFMGHHIMVPKEGVAVHINAFNFPVWGMLEKCAVNWLAGVPAIIKPATLTSYLTEAVVREIIYSKILPEGSIQLICGNARNILDYANYQDVITFTGSASTGFNLRSHPNIIKESIPFNMEADSLNCIILGEDVEVGSDEFHTFIKEVRREITAKCGQKCTAIRRIFVPENLMDDVQLTLSQSLSATTIGDPRVEGVKMGALAGIEQVEEVKQKIKELLRSSQMVYGNLEDFNLLGGNKEKGAFLPPVLLRNDRPFDATEVHNVEAFGPVSTLMPYRDVEEAIALSKLGKGSLCSTIVTGNDKIAKSYVLGAATHHGRILILNKESAGSSTGHGSPLPMLVHGGPGRAGGGEEMGGVRGVKHYLQRCAIQGSPST
ncbi:MAG TPA: phenylacetic acid degradation bifunctional protein PaaZ, partial [Saprospiraceae bacterium]|nr:phenylacetic acid degradation bifunctional protein PaaZ [Saprospiraceae bacterium]